MSESAEQLAKKVRWSMLSREVDGAGHAALDALVARLDVAQADYPEAKIIDLTEQLDDALAAEQSLKAMLAAIVERAEKAEARLAEAEDA